MRDLEFLSLCFNSDRDLETRKAQEKGLFEFCEILIRQESRSILKDKGMVLLSRYLCLFCAMIVLLSKQRRRTIICREQPEKSPKQDSIILCYAEWIIGLFLWTMRIANDFLKRWMGNQILLTDGIGKLTILKTDELI